jgi:hypothetical protein
VEHSLQKVVYEYIECYIFEIYKPRMLAMKALHLSSLNTLFLVLCFSGLALAQNKHMQLLAPDVGWSLGASIMWNSRSSNINDLGRGFRSTLTYWLASEYFEVQPNPAQARAAAGKLHALGRIRQPEEVGRLAVFLASEEAAFMTGAAVVVSGGFGIGLPPTAGAFFPH